MMTDYMRFFENVHALAAEHPEWDVVSDIRRAIYADLDLGDRLDFSITITWPSEMRHSEGDVEVVRVSAKSPEAAIEAARVQVTSFISAPKTSEPHKCSECGQVLP
jgi:hypothetical protein